MKKIIFAIVVHGFFFSSANASNIDHVELQETKIKLSLEEFNKIMNDLEKADIKEEKTLKLNPLNENDIDKERKKLNSELISAEFSLDSALETVIGHKKNIEACFKNLKPIPLNVEKNVKQMVDNFNQYKCDKNSSIGVLYKIGTCAEYYHILKQKNNTYELERLLQEAEQIGFIDEFRVILHLSKNQEKKLSKLYLKFKEFQKIFNRIGVNVEKLRLKTYSCELVLILLKEDIDCKITVNEIRSDEEKIITEKSRKMLEIELEKVKTNKLEINRVINMVLVFCTKNQIRLVEVEEYKN